MKFTLVGDIHNDPRMMNFQYLPPNSIQVGDFGFFYDHWLLNNEVKAYHSYDSDVAPNFAWKKEKRFFISGNHEMYSELKEDNDTIYELRTGLYHIPRCFVSGQVLFIGGGDSIDKNHRTAGRDWFPEEALNTRQWNKIIQNIEGKEILAVVAHDLPLCFYPQVEIPLDRAIGSHSKGLEEIFNIVKPKYWFCGHHHMTRFIKTQEYCNIPCNIRVLNIGEKIEVDLPINEDDFI